MECEIAVLMGSVSDLPKIQKTLDVFDEFSVPYTLRVMSAHRTPRTVAEFAETAREAGIKVIIAAAGLSAALAGTVAAHTTLPVIGIPLKGGALDGLDALLSTVQMPGGVPVGTMGLGSGGARNAALLALRILALHDEDIHRKLKEFRKREEEKVASADEDLQKRDLCNAD